VAGDRFYLCGEMGRFNGHQKNSTKVWFAIAPV